MRVRSWPNDSTTSANRARDDDDDYDASPGHAGGSWQREIAALMISSRRRDNRARSPNDTR